MGFFFYIFENNILSVSKGVQLHYLKDKEWKIREDDSRLQQNSVDIWEMAVKWNSTDTTLIFNDQKWISQTLIIYLLWNIDIYLVWVADRRPYDLDSLE